MSLVRPASPIRVFDDASDFSLLEAGWRALFERAGGWNVFLSWQWFRRWWESFGTGNELRILTLSRGDRLVGVVPGMIETDDGGRRQLALIGSDRTTDYGDLLADPEALDPLCESLADFVLDGFGEWERVQFRSIPGSSPLLGRFLHHVHRRGLVTRVRTSDTCPVARLAPTWDEFLATLSKKDRHELRRKIRRAESVGQQRVLSLISPEDVEAGLEDFFRLHRASAPEKAEFLDESTVSFFSGVALAFAREGWVRLNLMEMDGRNVAASISFSRGDRVMLYNSGLDPDYRVHSVGIALHAAEIQQAIEQGKVCYDFLRGNEPYKYRLGAEDAPIFTLTILPSGAGATDGGENRG